MASPARAAARRSERQDNAKDPLGDCSLFIAYCTPGAVDAQFCQSLTGFQTYDARHYGHCIRRGGIIGNETGPRLAHARNAIVREFIRVSHELFPDLPAYLLMVDSDMAFQPEWVYRLLNDMRREKGIGIAGGLCFGGGHSSPMFPTIYVYENEQMAREFRLTRLPFYPQDSFFDVDGTGAAFTLMSRDMLEEMPQHFPEPTPWYADTIAAGTDRDYGEDIVLCMRARAMGWRVIVNSTVKIDHMKRGKLNEEVYMTRLALMESAGLIPVEENEAGELVHVGD